MLELQTIKTDSLFKNSQDFNQTTHARPQHPIVFIHNISLYFNCISSVKYVFKWSHHGHITVTSCLFLQYDPSGLCAKPKNRVRLLRKVGKVLMCSSEWWLMKEGMKAIPKDLIHKYFIRYIVFQSL